MQYISTKEASENWGVTEQLVRRYCRQERISGVIQKDGAWLIPESFSSFSASPGTYPHSSEKEEKLSWSV